MIATMAALVLRLLVSSTKGTLHKMNDKLTCGAVRFVQLDRVLGNDGVEAKGARGARNRMESDAVAVRARAPRSDLQRELRSRALEPVADASTNRSLPPLQQYSSVSPPMLVVVVTWFVRVGGRSRRVQQLRDEDPQGRRRHGLGHGRGQPYQGRCIQAPTSRRRAAPEIK